MVEAQRRGRLRQDENSPVQEGTNESGKQKGLTPKPKDPVPTASLSSFLKRIHSFRKQSFDVEAFIPIGDLENPEGDIEEGGLNGAKLARYIAEKVWDATEYCFV